MEITYSGRKYRQVDNRWIDERGIVVPEMLYPLFERAIHDKEKPRTKYDILSILHFDLFINEIPWLDGWIEAALLYSDASEPPDGISEKLFEIVFDFKCHNNDIPENPTEYRESAAILMSQVCDRIWPHKDWFLGKRIDLSDIFEWYETKLNMSELEVHGFASSETVDAEDQPWDDQISGNIQRGILYYGNFERPNTYDDIDRIKEAIQEEISIVQSTISK